MRIRSRTSRGTDRPATVAEMALQLPEDGGDGEGREGGAALGVEAVDRLDQSDARDLDQIVEWLNARVARGEASSERHEALDQLAHRRGRVLGVAPQQRPLVRKLLVGAGRGAGPFSSRPFRSWARRCRRQEPLTRRPRMPACDKVHLACSDRPEHSSKLTGLPGVSTGPAARRSKSASPDGFTNAAGGYPTDESRQRAGVRRPSTPAPAHKRLASPSFASAQAGLGGRLSPPGRPTPPWSRRPCRSAQLRRPPLARPSDSITPSGGLRDTSADRRRVRRRRRRRDRGRTPSPSRRSPWSTRPATSSSAPRSPPPVNHHGSGCDLGGGPRRAAARGRHRIESRADARPRR